MVDSGRGAGRAASAAIVIYDDVKAVAEKGESIAMRRRLSAVLAVLVVLAPGAWADADRLARFAADERIADVSRFEAVIDALRRTGALPAGQFVTKFAAEAQGWHPGGDLCTVLPGESIGGDPFDNREGRLPRGAAYREADLDYHCGHRSAKRLVYDAAGHQWVTIDHYRSFQPVP